MISDPAARKSAVLLLGASGRLGTMLRAFWPEPEKLICHSRTASPGFVAFDLLTERDEAVEVMRGIGAVICLSGVTNDRAAAGGGLLEDNVDLACAAAQAAALAGQVQVFVASSAAVYGAAQGPHTEDAVCAPVSDYGNAKLRMEDKVHAAHPGQPVTALRIGNVAGADAILGGWRKGMQIDALEDGTTPRRSYIGPLTLARVLHGLCGMRNLPSTLNIAAPGTVEMGALLDAAGLPWVPRPAAVGVIPQVELATDRLEQLVSFAPENSTAEGLVSEWRRFEATT